MTGGPGDAVGGSGAGGREAKVEREQESVHWVDLTTKRSKSTKGKRRFCADGSWMEHSHRIGSGDEARRGPKWETKSGPEYKKNRPNFGDWADWRSKHPFSPCSAS